MFRQKDRWLWGLKMIGVNDQTLLATGLIDRKVFRQNQEEWPIEEISLEEGERLVGFKSRIENDCFYDF